MFYSGFISTGYLSSLTIVYMASRTYRCSLSIHGIDQQSTVYMCIRIINIDKNVDFVLSLFMNNVLSPYQNKPTNFPK